MDEKIDEEALAKHYNEEDARAEEMINTKKNEDVLDDPVGKPFTLRDELAMARSEYDALLELFRIYVESVIDRDSLAPTYERTLIMLFGENA